MPIATNNKKKMNAMDTYAEVARCVQVNECWDIAEINSANAGFDIFDDENDYDRRPNSIIDASDFIVDIREYDVPYHVRVAIDKGNFYSVFLPLYSLLKGQLQISASGSGIQWKQSMASSVWLVLKSACNVPTLL
jgi:hypothetical protein